MSNERKSGHVVGMTVVDEDGAKYALSVMEFSDLDEAERVTFEVSRGRRGKLWAVRVIPRM